ncbi:MAG: glycosyltransferase [Deltaproteobacteria bacterium]|nr:glycosyltransferase [Deltaproteobacteria bacterium]
MSRAPVRVLAWPAFENKKQNPYNWLLYSNMSRESASVEEFSTKKLLFGTHDVLHIHWPEWQISHKNFFLSLFRFIRLLLILDMARFKKIRIVWTVHNLADHEKYHKKLAAIFRLSLIRRLDGFISLSSVGKDQALRLYPSLGTIQNCIIPHGHYRDVYPNSVDFSEARKFLDIPLNKKVLLYFGLIRPYKNVVELIHAFKKLANHDLVLLIAGKPHSAQLGAEIKDAAHDDSRIRLFLDFVDENQLQTFFNACNLVIFPFQENLNSGSALLALSFNRPILVPDMGSFAELQTMVGKAWVNIYSNRIGPKIIEECLDNITVEDVFKIAPLNNLSWQNIAKDTAQFFHQVSGVNDNFMHID